MMPVLLKRLSVFKNEKNVSLQKNNNLLVSVKGLTDSLFVKKLAGGSLHFGITQNFNLNEVLPFISKADEKLSAINETLPDSFLYKIRNGESNAAKILAPDVNKSTEKIYPLQKILSGGTPVNNANSYLLTDSASVAKLQFWFTTARQLNLFPEQIKLVSSAASTTSSKGFQKEFYFIHDIGNNPLAIQKNEIKELQPNYDEKGRPSITGQMTGTATKKWEYLTRNFINQPLPMVLDDEVICAPTVIGEIKGGSFSITGNYTDEETINMVTLISAEEYEVAPRIKSCTVTETGKDNFTSNLVIAGIIVFHLFTGLSFVVFRFLLTPQQLLTKA